MHASPEGILFGNSLSRKYVDARDTHNLFEASLVSKIQRTGQWWGRGMYSGSTRDPSESVSYLVLHPSVPLAALDLSEKDMIHIVCNTLRRTSIHCSCSFAHGSDLRMNKALSSCSFLHKESDGFYDTIGTLGCRGLVPVMEQS